MPGGFPLGLEICSGLDFGTVLSATNGTAVTLGFQTKGAWTPLVAATPFDTSWIVATSYFYPSADGTGIESFDIGIGASGSEIPIINNLTVSPDYGGWQASSYGFPISIPAGTRISTRGSASGHSADVTANTAIQIFDGAFTQMEGCAGVDSIGWVGGAQGGTIITAGGTANVKGSFTQLIAPTPRDYLGICVGIDYGTTLNSFKTLLVDIAIGPSGSELTVLPNILSASPDSGLHTPYLFLPVPIKAGTRVAARCQCSTASEAIGITVYGVYQ